MTLDRLSQITEVGIKSGITLNGINVIGVVTATSLTVNGGAVVNGVVTATSFSGNVTGNITPTGLVVSGVSTFQASSFWGDGDIAYFGDGQDLLIFHNSTDSIIRDNGTGDLFIEGGNVIRMTNPTGIETYATFNQDAAVELYYDNAKKFETTSGGASITGDLVVSGIITSGTSTITIDGPNNSITVGSAFIKNNSVGLGTTTTAGKNAGVGTATGTLIYNASTNLVEIYTPYGWDIVGKQTNTITATGGNTVDTSSRPGYKVHIFTGPGTFAVSGGFNDVEYLVVAGGGGAGGDVGGGAGAGGYRTGTFTVSPGNYPVFVGGGGSGHPFNSPGTNGVPSYFGSIVSEGGGFGTRGGASSPGGSGGGTPYDSSTGWGYGINPSTPQPVLDPYSLTAPYPVTQGNPGGSNAGGGSGGGGGGGAGAAGSNGTGPSGAAVGGAGGAGLPSSITGSPVTRGGGGAGAGYQAPGASGGAGGGGPSGGGSPGNPGSAGSANTGGGGGSGSSSGAGAGGGSGIVIIAYPTA